MILIVFFKKDENSGNRTKKNIPSPLNDPHFVIFGTLDGHLGGGAY